MDILTELAMLAIIISGLILPYTLIAWMSTFEIYTYIQYILFSYSVQLLQYAIVILK